MKARQADSVRVPLLGAGALQAYVSWEDHHRDWAVVYVHGFGSTRVGLKAQALEAACARRGWTYASFDFRGHGESTGTLLELRGTILLEDLDVLRAYLASRGIRRLCPVGSSMGGWAAAWFTLRQPHTVPSCVLIAPALQFLESRWNLLTDAERRTWKNTGRLRIQNQWVDTEIGYGIAEDMDQFPTSQLAAKLARPALILQGVRDEVVPYQQCIAFLERAAFPGIELRLYKDGDHRLLDYKDEIAEAACDFFARHSTFDTGR